VIRLRTLRQFLPAHHPPRMMPGRLDGLRLSGAVEQVLVCSG
jgi:hypothetical protein